MKFAVCTRVVNIVYMCQETLGDSECNDLAAQYMMFVTVDHDVIGRPDASTVQTTYYQHCGVRWLHFLNQH